MRELFVDTDFRAASLQMIAQCNDVIARYTAMGYRLTLRQLYYQLVSANIVPNTERSYKNLGALISKARLAGLVDWAAIEDRGREPKDLPDFEDLRELIEWAVGYYRLPRWSDQPYYAELWVEKDALAGVLLPLAQANHVTLMVNRGYSSQSAMYDASKRFIDGANNDQDCVLFYLGDQDPSGEDMVRDIAYRLDLMGSSLDVRKIAITPDQITTYAPPPNPAKMTDSRAAKYVEKFGYESYEVDALPPDVLQGIIQDAFDEIIDRDAMDAWLAREAADKAQLRGAVDQIVDAQDDTEQEDEDDDNE